MKRHVVCLALLAALLLGIPTTGSVCAYAAPQVTPAKPTESAKPAETAKEEDTTKLKTFLGNKGILLICDAQLAGTVKGPEGEYSFLGISALSVYQPGKEAIKIKGIRCDMYRAKGYGLSDDKSCMIDLDEAESLSNALKYLIDLAGTLKDQPLGKDDERRAVFMTKDDFSVGVTKSGTDGVIVPFVSIGGIASVRIDFKSVDTFTVMKTTVDKAIEWLTKQ